MRLGLAALWRPGLAKRLNRRGSGCAKSVASRSGFVLQQAPAAARTRQLCRKISAFLHLCARVRSRCGLTFVYHIGREAGFDRRPERRYRLEMQVPIRYRGNRLLTASCNAAFHLSCVTMSRLGKDEMTFDSGHYMPGDSANPAERRTGTAEAPGRFVRSLIAAAISACIATSTWELRERVLLAVVADPRARRRSAAAGAIDCPISGWRRNGASSASP